MRKGVSSVPETCFPVRREGFETAAPAGTNSQPFNAPQESAQPAADNLRSISSSTASPSKTPGLLSRTFSSGTNNEAIKVSPLFPHKVTSVWKLQERVHVVNLLSPQALQTCTNASRIAIQYPQSTGEIGALPGEQRECGR